MNKISYVKIQFMKWLQISSSCYVWLCVYVCVCVGVPAGRLGQDIGELTVSVDTVVFVVIWAGDVKTAGEWIILFHHCVKHTNSKMNPCSINSGCGHAEGRLCTYVMPAWWQTHTRVWGRERATLRGDIKVNWVCPDTLTCEVGSCKVPVSALVPIYDITCRSAKKKKNQNWKWCPASTCILISKKSPGGRNYMEHLRI